MTVVNWRGFSPTFRMSMIAINPDPEHYQSQLDDKIQHLQQAFTKFDPPKIEVFPSVALHFRHRADFALWHDGDDCHYAVFPNGRDHPPQYLNNFAIASEQINSLMTALLPVIKSETTLKHKLFQVNFHSTLAGDAIITLVYHKPLDANWLSAANALQQQLQVNIVGRSRKQKQVIGRDYVREAFFVNNRPLHYRQQEGCFTQSNANICQRMLNWVDQVLAAQAENTLSSDLLELYCGNGNFTLAMSRHFRRVLATELVKQLVHTANHNCQDNNIGNIDIVRLAADEVVDALNKVRPFRRLQHIELDTYNFSTLFVDPPRSGLDATCHQLAKNFDHIVYISCNPDTLSRDLEQLSRSHRIQRMAVFDQFPYTHHLECGVSLQRR